MFTAIWLIGLIAIAASCVQSTTTSKEVDVNLTRSYSDEGDKVLSDAFGRLQDLGHQTTDRATVDKENKISGDTDNKLDSLMNKLNMLLNGNSDKPETDQKMEKGVNVVVSDDVAPQRSLVQAHEAATLQLATESTLSQHKVAVIKPQHKKSDTKLRNSLKKMVDNQIKRKLYDESHIEEMIHNEVLAMQEAKRRITIKKKQAARGQIIKNVDLPSLDLRRYRQANKPNSIYKYDDSKYDLNRAVSSLELMMHRVTECRVKIVEMIEVDPYSQSSLVSQKSECRQAYNVTIKILAGLDKWCLNVVYNYILTETNVSKLTKYVDDFHLSGDINKDRAMVKLSQFKQIYEQHHVAFSMQEYRSAYEYRVRYLQEFFQKKFTSQVDSLSYMSKLMNSENTAAEFVEFNHLMTFLSDINTDLDTYETQDAVKQYKVDEQRQAPFSQQVIVVDNLNDLKNAHLFNDKEVVVSPLNNKIRSRVNIPPLNMRTKILEPLPITRIKPGPEVNKVRRIRHHSAHKISKKHETTKVLIKTKADVNPISIDGRLESKEEKLDPTVFDPDHENNVHAFNNDIDMHHNNTESESEKVVAANSIQQTSSNSTDEPQSKNQLVYTDSPDYEKKIDDELKEVPDETSKGVNNEPYGDDDGTYIDGIPELNAGLSAQKTQSDALVSILHPDVIKSLDQPENKKIIEQHSDSEEDEKKPSPQTGRESEEELSSKLKQLLGNSNSDDIIPLLMKMRNRESPAAGQTIEQKTDTPTSYSVVTNPEQRADPNLSGKEVEGDHDMPSDPYNSIPSDEKYDIHGPEQPNKKNELSSDIVEGHNAMMDELLKQHTNLDVDIQKHPSVDSAVNSKPVSLEKVAATKPFVSTTSNEPANETYVAPRVSDTASASSIDDTDAPDDDMLKKYGFNDEDFFSIQDAISHGKLGKPGLEMDEIVPTKPKLEEVVVPKGPLGTGYSAIASDVDKAYKSLPYLANNVEDSPTYKGSLVSKTNLNDKDGDLDDKFSPSLAKQYNSKSLTEEDKEKIKTDYENLIAASMAKHNKQLESKQQSPQYEDDVKLYKPRHKIDLLKKNFADRRNKQPLQDINVKADNADYDTNYLTALKGKKNRNVYNQAPMRSLSDEKLSRHKSKSVKPIKPISHLKSTVSLKPPRRNLDDDTASAHMQATNTQHTKRVTTQKSKTDTKIHKKLVVNNKTSLNPLISSNIFNSTETSINSKTHKSEIRHSAKLHAKIGDQNIHIKNILLKEGIKRPNENHIIFDGKLSKKRDVVNLKISHRHIDTKKINISMKKSNDQSKKIVDKSVQLSKIAIDNKDNNHDSKHERVLRIKHYRGLI